MFALYAVPAAFDSRVEHSGKASVSHIVIYSFAEFSAQVCMCRALAGVSTLHTACGGCSPQIVLEAPLDVFCFKWNPWQSNLIAAGCSSGQVLLYDIADAMATISKTKTKTTKSLSSHSSSESVGTASCSKFARTHGIGGVLVLCAGEQDGQMHSREGQVHVHN